MVALWFLLSFLLFFFLAYSQPSEIGCLPYSQTWCSLTENLERRSEMCFHAGRWKYRTQKIAKNSSYGHHRTTLSGCVFATKVYIDNRKKLAKRQYLLHFGPLPAKVGLEHRSKFQRVSRVGFVSAPTSLNGRHPNIARCLAVSGAGILYIHCRRLLPLREFCHVQNSLCVQVLRSPILAALLHGTRAVGVSQTLKRSTRSGIKELL